VVRGILIYQIGSGVYGCGFGCGFGWNVADDGAFAAH